MRVWITKVGRIRRVWREGEGEGVSKIDGNRQQKN